MNKYKDSFETRTESLGQGGRGILTALENKDPGGVPKKARAPEFSKPRTNSNISPIRTLADDLESTVEDEKITLSKHVLDAQKRKTQEQETIRTQYKSEKRGARKRRPPSAVFILFFSALLLFGGSLLLFTSKLGVSIPHFNFSRSGFSLGPLFNKEDPMKDTGFTFPEKLLATQEEKEFPINENDNIASIKEALNTISTGASKNELIALFPDEIRVGEEGTRRIFIDISNLFTLLKISADSSLERSIDKYTFGVQGGGEARAFLVAHVRSHDEAFGAMLSYEGDILYDLYGLFHNDIDLALNKDKNEFQDIVVSGHDARVATKNTESGDKEGGSVVTKEDVLIYSFVSDNILVITRNRDDLARIILALNQS